MKTYYDIQVIEDISTNRWFVLQSTEEYKNRLVVSQGTCSTFDDACFEAMKARHNIIDSPTEK